MKNILIKLGIKKQNLREIQKTTVFKYQPIVFKKENIGLYRHIEKIL